MLKVFQTVKEAVRPYYLRWLFFRLSEGNCPRVLRDWTGHSSTPLDEVGPDFFPVSQDLPDFVFLPMADWHGITQRSQHLANGLAKLGHRCLYLNPHLGREFPKPFPWSERALVTRLCDRVFEIHVHLPLEPVFHHRRLFRGEITTIAERISTTLKAMESHDQILVISFPIWTEVARELSARLHCPVVYDCHDLLEDFGDIPLELLESESEAMGDADLVLFSADWLANAHHARSRTLAEKSVLIRNAANPGDFPFSPLPNPQPVPTIGYTGSLNSWFDVEAFQHAARQHPDWRFILVGAASPSFPADAFRHLPNVRLTGEVPYAQIPDWLSQFDVAVIPFRIQPLTQATNPVKLYEYFAHGLPVVAARLPELEVYGDLLYSASTPAEFVVQLERAVEERDPALRLRRRHVAEAETWDARCESLVSACLQLASRPTTLSIPGAQ